MHPYMIRYLNQLLYVAELSTATLLLARSLPRRRRWGVALLGYLALLALALYLLVVVKDMVMGHINAPGVLSLFIVVYISSFLAELIVFSLGLLIVRAVFEVSFSHAVFIACAGYSTRNLAHCIVTLVCLLVTEESAFDATKLLTPSGTLLYFGVFVPVYLVCYLVFFRRCRQGDEVFLDARLLRVLILLAAANMLLNAVNAPKNSLEADILYSFVLFARILFCLVGLIIQFFVLSWEKLVFRQSQMEHILSTQKEQFEIAKRSIETVNINAHDLKHQLSLLTSAIRLSGGSGEMQQELERMNRYVEDVDTVFHTGSKALDITLTEKARICREQLISLSVVADGRALGFLADVDLYTLLGNALDNAIEATEAVPEPEKRTIALSVRQEKGMVSIHLENTFATAPRFVNGLPQTSKADQRFHGYGVRSMQRVVSQYEGNLTTHVDGDLFHVDILFFGQTPTE